MDNIKTAGRYIADKLMEANVYCEECGLSPSFSRLKLAAMTTFDLVDDIPDVGHGWDKTARDGTWEAERRNEVGFPQ